MSRTGDPTCNAFQEALARIANGFVHEINNKLGPILLNAESLAMSVPTAKGVAVEIARNANELMEMMRDLEGMLPGNIERSGSFATVMRRIERIARGALRHRRLRVELPAIDRFSLFDTCPSRILPVFSLVPFVYRGPLDGGLATLRVTYSEPGVGWRWRFEVDPHSERDEKIIEAIATFCGRQSWILSTGDHWLEVAADKEALDVV